MAEFPKDIECSLVDRIRRAGDVESFRFQPAERVDFIPGQFLQVIFDRNARNNGNLNKYLSFSCAPGKNYIEVTKKLSQSEFSKELKKLRKGNKVLIKMPMGTCVFREEYKKIGFLIGGIGITPVISIIEHVVEKHIPADAVLLYSNKTEEMTAFKKELDGWGQENKNIKVVYAVSDARPDDDKIFFGRINKEFFLEHVKDCKERTFFIFGPPAMVSAMKDICIESGCSEKMVLTENFIGY